VAERFPNGIRRWLFRLAAKASLPDRNHYLSVDDFYRIRGNPKAFDIDAFTAGDVVAKAMRTACYRNALQFARSQRSTGVRAFIAYGENISLDVEKRDIFPDQSYYLAFSRRKPA
jgi:hypothetical protein